MTEQKEGSRLSLPDCEMCSWFRKARRIFPVNDRSPTPLGIEKEWIMHMGRYHPERSRAFWLIRGPD